MNEVSSLPPWGIPCFISPCEKGNFLEASLQGSALGWFITCSRRIKMEPSLRTQHTGCLQQGQVSAVPSAGACGAGAEPSKNGLGHPRQSQAWGMVRTPQGPAGVEPAPFQPGQDGGHRWLQCLLCSLLSHHGVRDSQAPKGNWSSATVACYQLLQQTAHTAPAGWAPCSPFTQPKSNLKLSDGCSRICS